MAYIYDIADTWAASGTVFTGIKLNVVDTASAAGSLLMDLQVGGVSQFKVAKNGDLTGRKFISSFWVEVGSSVIVRGEGVYVGSAAEFGFGSFPNPQSGPADVVLRRDAANTLAQRNGVNAQAFNLYNTYTDASNYERGVMRWATNILTIGSEGSGTGSTNRTTVLSGGSVFLNSTNSGNSMRFQFGGSDAIYFDNTSVIRLPNNSGQYKIGTSSDVGVGRSAAGIAKITDGSTGTGQLIFIVPTTNPGITGALWNNAGTLAIS